MGSRILFDSVIENDTGTVYASSQSGAVTTPINLDQWDGASKVYATGIYKGYEAKEIRFKIYQAANYDGSVPNVVPVPTAAQYGNGNTGNGTVVMSTYGTWPNGTHAGLRVVLTRNGSNQWTGNFYSGLASGTPIAITVTSDDWTYTDSGNDYFKIVTTDGSTNWASGDTVTFYAYPATYKLSTDGGVTYGSATTIHSGAGTWCDNDYTLTLTNGLSVRIVLDTATRAFYADDYVDITAGYENGIDQLFSQPRTDLWKSKRGGYQCIFVDAGANVTADTLAVLDRTGAIALYYTTSANLIGTCTGALASTGATLNLTIDGDTWSDDIDGGKLWITSGDAMGYYYTISSVSDPAVTLNSNPADDGATTGDRYLIIPDDSASAAVFSADSGDDIKYFTSTTGRGWWIRFYSSSLSQMQASIIRLGDALAPEVAPIHMPERKMTPGDEPSRGVTNVINSRAVGYSRDVYPVEYDLMTKDDRDDIWGELDTYISPDYARFMLFVPYTGSSNTFAYGRVMEPLTEDLNRLWARFSCRLELAPYA